MYTYPARCWRKKRRLDNSADARLGIYGLHLGKVAPTPPTTSTTTTTTSPGNT